MCQNPIKYSSGWPENAITSTHYYVNCHLWYFFITVSYILTGNVILIPVCSWLASWKKIILQFSVIVEAIFTKGNEIGFVLVFSVSIFHRVCQFYFLSSTFLFTCVILLLTRFLCVFHSSSPLLLLITLVWLRPCLLAFVCYPCLSADVRCSSICSWCFYTGFLPLQPVQWTWISTHPPPFSLYT